MALLELRIVSGARAGQEERFDRDVVTIGRNPDCALRFDADRDRDASGLHAEIRRTAAGWTIVDRGSTNGTFVNGERISGDRQLAIRDRIGFGVAGPVVEVVGLGPESAHRGPGAGRNTEERVAIAVASQTRGMKVLVAASIVTVAVIAGGGLWFMKQRADREIATLRSTYISSTAAIRDQLARLGDTAAVRQLDLRNDSLTRAHGAIGVSDLAAVRTEVEQNRVAQQGLVSLSRSGVAARNGNAVAYLVVYYGDQRFGGTAFCVTADGLLVTNRHNVEARDGAAPTRVIVKFANTDVWKAARVVKMSDSPDTDLALLKIDEPGRYPTVAGVSGSASLTQGDPIAIIGFPSSTDLPMDGLMARTTLNAGMTSKRAPGILQLESYASHGSSGSPVFDSLGVVVGVVYGGDPRAQGKVVFAVPSDRLAEFLPPEAKAAVRP